MASAGETIENPVTGERIRFLRTAADTGGELLLLEDVWTRPDHRVAPHVHPGMDETWEVLAGVVAFAIDGEETLAERGDTVTAPAGATHSGVNAGGGEVRMRLAFRPALRWEEVVETLFRYAREGRTDTDGVPEPALLAELLREYPRELAPPP